MFNSETSLLLKTNLEQLPVMTGGRSLRHDIDELAAMVFPPCRLAVVDDVHTSEAYGNRVQQALKGRFAATHITLEGGLEASTDAVEDVLRRSEGTDALVAVGSGTINDICKYASFKKNQPYIVFPTAASMNGYVSANASISHEGYRQTLPAHMPKAVFCDFSVIAAAPARLSKSGLGDSLARSTAQADWLLSHLLLGTDYNEVPFALIAPLEPHLLENAPAIAQGDMASIELLMQVLLLSGFGMTIAGGSYPASQSEHMIAHAYHMLHRPYAGPGFLHGEEIGVTTCTVASLQEQLLRSTPSLQDRDFPQDELRNYFGAHTATEAKKAYYQKLERIEQAALSRDSMKARWDEIAGRLQQVMIPAARIRAILKAADAPLAPEDLHWPPAEYKMAVHYARFLRDRFTALDLIQS